jgi:glutaredoxin
MMRISPPSTKDFTIYSKSGCINCRKVKDFLKNNNQSYEVIDCDDYLFENKEFFLSFINNCAKKECKIFPMVFNKGDFIGGYDETVTYLDKIKAFDFEV